MADRPLRLAAEDADDLQIMSAALQDAVVKVGDISFDARARRLTLTVNRYRWEERIPQRVRSALSLESVLGVRSRRVRFDEPDRVASILAVEFEPDDEPPSGSIQIRLSGGGDISAVVECVDALLLDVSPPWPASAKPRHQGT